MLKRMIGAVKVKTQEDQDIETVRQIAAAINQNIKAKQQTKIRPSQFLNNFESVIPETRRYNVLLPTLSPRKSQMHKLSENSSTLSLPSLIQKRPIVDQQKSVKFRQSVVVVDFINGVISKGKISDSNKPLRRALHRPSRSGIELH